MRKKNILLLLFTLLTPFIAAQINNNGIQPKQLVPFPTSAGSYNLSKVEKVPIDYFRGKANINIPIYTISVDGIHIPISLSSNTGGIKLNEVSSSVGLGWVLNIPGTISQNVVGSDDLDVPFFSKNISDYAAYTGNIDINSSNEMRSNIESLYNNHYDTQKDIFDYSLPTASGSFLLKDNNQTFLIPNDDIIITRNNDRFYIKDTQGAEYWMSPRNGIMSASIGGPTVWHKTLYNLDELKINNKSVLFYYNKAHSYDERNINEVANFKVTPKFSGNFEELIPLPKYEKTETSTSFSESLISKISFDNGEVKFLYSNDANSAFADGSSYRKDLSSGNGIALRKIIVTSKAGVIIKDISLNYSYFETDNANKTYEDYRLKLISVRDNLQNTDYSFEYNEQYKIPKRSSSNDDYWGYINSINNGETTNIPNKIFDYNIPSVEFDGIVKRNRESNEEFAVLGSLKSIKYPTGAKKIFYYELPYNTIRESTGEASGFLPIGALRTIATETDFDETVKFQITPAHLQQIQNLGIDAYADKVKVDFANTCKNADNTGNGQVIDETQCTGSVKYGQKGFSDWRPHTAEWEAITGRDLEFNLFKIGTCKCSISGSIKYLYPIYTDKMKKYGTLRIRKIEDVDANNLSNVYEYTYGKYDNGVFVPDLKLNQKYNFSSIIKRQVREFTDAGHTTQLGSAFEKYYRLHNSSQANTSYGSSDLINYPSVVEITDKGKIIREYETSGSSNYVYNKWKGGRLKREIYLNKANDTLKIIKNIYQLNTLKNGLSEFTTNIPKVAAFSTDFTITRGIMTLLGTPVEIYNVEYLMYLIESAKVENHTSETTDYFNGIKVVTKSNYEYYDTDINRPINLKSIKNILPTGETVQTNYQYAHEKGNQLMIDKNMVGIPLETTATQTIGNTTKTLSKTATNYPLNQAEANTKTAGLVLPTFVLSYDLQDPTFPSTEVTYDKYDAKGNLQQYTTKDGLPVSIIWGYNNTKPIAKIEGAKLADISQSLINNIVTASDADGQLNTNASDQSLNDALDLFRNNAAFSGYQISTYTYDPLIGVRSITPPSGIREVYMYDTANRLKEIRENNTTGKLLKEYQYNYKN